MEKKHISVNGPKKEAGIVILISGKIDFKPKLVRRNREGHYILIKEHVFPEDIAFFTMYATNTGHPSS